MSVLNIKSRCAALGITLTQLWEEVRNSDPKFNNLTFYMFCDMHLGRYRGGMAQEVLSKAHEILCSKEATQAQKKVAR